MVYQLWISSSVSSPPREALTRGISFGEVATIGKFIPSKEMLPTKDRPPTPVPSLEALAVLVKEEPIELKPPMEDSNEEQKKLISLFKAIHEYLYFSLIRYFETRPPVSKIMYSPGLSGTQLRIHDVVRRLTEKISESEDAVLLESDEIHMAEEYLIQELQSRLPFLKESSKENLQGVRRPSI
ncbi:hypothetical protein R5R35_010508 [Gryllus longicercus]|uniref:Uncharacterized protein n=1 Tax=Gryllus longicercus TaxID=2509291 RepID=A0AAN9Z5F2_9ORTH